MKEAVIVLLLITGLPAFLYGCNGPGPDTIVAQRSPLLLKGSLLFSNRLIGGQVGLGRMLSWKEKHISKHSGKQKITSKQTVLYGNMVYYDHPGLHRNWMLTAQYDMYRFNKKGFYTEFTPLLGVSRTFLPGTTYKVDDAGNVSILKLAGNWTLTGGFGLGAGKYFTNSGPLKTISLKLITQVFYPNFRFIAFKPHLELNTAWQLSKMQTHVNKRIKLKYSNGKK
ncbi:hypothetical protein [Dyadobacter arcticus]|uniref:Uncharacterized protein n=1 Tax=Dyadobacter arcticus TaxID=1078754 RepID=A0ABX0UGY7_9BACT|nr:hypothetical protein [Dyadobacter arcticus]NIJ52279.1 hypothetical protein [Dyadobacter arcticus]